MLREAIALGVDYVDLEMDVARKIRRFGKTKRIISYHNLKKTPTEFADIAEQCDEMDADVVKIATNAESLDRCRYASSSSEPESSCRRSPSRWARSGSSPGSWGPSTRRRSPTPASTPSGSSPRGCPPFQVLKHDYAYDKINAETEVYAVIGDPIDQSLSPAIHNAAFRHLGLNKVMVPILIPAGTLEASLKELDGSSIKGYSVTIPHKEDIVTLLDQKDGAVERTGSCNTLVFQNGKKIGYNTDYRAAMDSLEDALGGAEGRWHQPPARQAGPDPRGRGSGPVDRLRPGAARRERDHHQPARRPGHQAGRGGRLPHRELGQRASTLADIVINCTPVGMHPDVDDTPVPPATFSKPGMLVFDTVYHPENTMFLKLARERECITVNGVDMFVRQAAEQFKLYTGRGRAEGRDARRR